MTINQQALAELLADCQATDGHRIVTLGLRVTVCRIRWNGKDFDYQDFTIASGVTARQFVQVQSEIRTMLGGLKGVLAHAEDGGEGGAA